MEYSKLPTSTGEFAGVQPSTVEIRQKKKLGTTCFLHCSKGGESRPNHQTVQGLTAGAKKGTPAFRRSTPSPKKKWYTPRKINIEPENDGLEDDFPFPGVRSQVPAVSLPGCMCVSVSVCVCVCLIIGEKTHQKRCVQKNKPCDRRCIAQHRLPHRKITRKICTRRGLKWEKDG